MVERLQKEKHNPDGTGGTVKNIVKKQDSCYNGCRILDDGKRVGTPMHISYQPLWNTVKERGVRKEDLRLAAGLTTNRIANMGKGKHISMATLLRICETLDCDITDGIKLVEEFTVKDRRSFLETQIKSDQNRMVDILRRDTQ